jgi:chromosome segregation ATPase
MMMDSVDAETAKRRKGKIPDRKKYDEEVEALMSQIGEKEAQLKSVVAVRPDANTDDDKGAKREGLLADLRKLKRDREIVLGERSKSDQELTQLNANIQKMRENMTKLQSGLKFKSEQQVDDAIKKLEQRLQAQTQRLSLTEEKRVVGEISTLKASKRNIQEFAAAKEKFDSERARQGKLRDQREEYFKRLSEIREEESHVKSLLDGLKGKQDEAWAEYKQRLSKKDAIRKEIDELYAKKKELVAQNKKQLDVYFEGIRSQKKARYEEETRRKEEERRIAHEAYQKEMSEFLKTREPYKTERDRCSALISYLTPLGSSVVVGAGSSAVSGSPTVSNLAPVRSDEFKSPQGIFRRKKDDEDNLSGYFGGTGKGKKGKKGKRVAAMQKAHTILNYLMRQILNNASVCSGCCYRVLDC